MTLKIDGGILAGGLASRMQGHDKGLQAYKNKAMAQWIFDALKPHVDEVIINCNRNDSAYQQISSKLCHDEISGFQGPLAGLHSLMKHSQADYLLVSPCDTPLLGLEFGQTMITALRHHLEQTPDKHLIIAAKDEHRNHPLHLCISTQLADSLEEALVNKQNRVMKWMKEHSAIWLDFSAKQRNHPEFFVNFNTLEDLAKT